MLFSLSILGILFYIVHGERVHLYYISREIQDIDYISLISTDHISNVVISSVFVTIPDGRALVRSFMCLPVRNCSEKRNGQKLKRPVVSYGVTEGNCAAIKINVATGNLTHCVFAIDESLQVKNQNARACGLCLKNVSQF